MTLAFTERQPENKIGALSRVCHLPQKNTRATKTTREQSFVIVLPVLPPVNQVDRFSLSLNLFWQLDLCTNCVRICYYRDVMYALSGLVNKHSKLHRLEAPPS
jgi:hypothetical protein